MNELEAIEQAVSGLYRPDYRRILIEKYLEHPAKPNWQIAHSQSGLRGRPFRSC